MLENPRPIGAILASDDPTAMDVAVSRLMNLDPTSIGTIRIGDRGADMSRTTSPISPTWGMPSRTSWSKISRPPSQETLRRVLLAGPA